MKHRFTVWWSCGLVTHGHGPSKVAAVDESVRVHERDGLCAMCPAAANNVMRTRWETSLDGERWNMQADSGP